LRGKEDNVETIEIEASLVGLIIGRQGENLRRVESESRCRVQFIPPTGQNDQFRLCRITGPRPQREEAKEMINHIIQDSGMRSGNPQAGGERGGREGGGRGPAPPPVPKEGEDSLQIMVPDRTVGLIIGRGGETIRDLQERSGCHINIVSENKSVNGLRPVNLIGAPAAARHAKELILEIVDSDSRNGNNAGAARGGRPDSYGGGGGGGGGGGAPDKVNDSIYVPSDAVGMIIGKGGETIREMQNMTGCKINVSQSSGPGEVEREIGLVGSRDAIAQAKRAIEDKVDAAVCLLGLQAILMDTHANEITEAEVCRRRWTWPWPAP
jgi:far upstream element-binding protein